jgi:hypothetical protein
MQVLRWVVPVGLALAAGDPVRAEMAVAWSAPDRSYGWCADADAAAAGRCAADYCRDAGGAACQTLVTCAAGFTAMAKPEKPATGIAVACGLSSPDWARIMALAACVSASETLCWTDAAVMPDGSEIDPSQNEPFDLALYAGLMLEGQGYGPVGTSGATTPELTAAVLAFQRDMARPETGSTAAPLLFDLIAAAGGRTVVANAIRTGVLERYGGSLAGNIAVAMTATRPRSRFTDDLAAMSAVDRADAMAALVRASGASCAAPVALANLPPGIPDIFTLTCADQVHVVVMQPDGGRTVQSTPVAP